MAAKTGRSPARQTRDAEATKTQILDAAEEEFARFGLMAARTEVIASKTGVTKAMIWRCTAENDLSENWNPMMLEIVDE